MSYNQDIFIDNCVMRLVQLAAAIRQNCERSEQNNDALASQEFDADEIECQEFDRMEKEIDACEVD